MLKKNKGLFALRAAQSHRLVRRSKVHERAARRNDYQETKAGPMQPPELWRMDFKETLL
jgi:hypothetical protein